VVVLAVHVDAAQATVIKLPTIMTTMPNPFKSLILATTKEGRLSVGCGGVSSNIGVDDGAARRGAGRFERVESADRDRHFDRRLTTGLVPCTAVRFEWFAERTGAVLLVMDGLGLLEIDLRTKEATGLRRGATDVRGAFLLEIDIDMTSLLNNMRPF
jgi:hypothetical protein